MRMSLIEWLLESDPSIRWQVMRDLIGESDATITLEYPSGAPRAALGKCVLT